MSCRIKLHDDDTKAIYNLWYCFVGMTKNEKKTFSFNYQYCAQSQPCFEGYFSETDREDCGYMMQCIFVLIYLWCPGSLEMNLCHSQPETWPRNWCTALHLPLLLSSVVISGDLWFVICISSLENAVHLCCFQSAYCNLSKGNSSQLADLAWFAHIGLLFRIIVIFLAEISRWLLCCFSYWSHMWQEQNYYFKLTISYKKSIISRFLNSDFLGIGIPWWSHTYMKNSPMRFLEWKWFKCYGQTLNFRKKLKGVICFELWHPILYQNTFHSGDTFHIIIIIIINLDSI